ncbi:MAG: tRNA dihydrouridine synthase DusB, partial [candidate division Zixibacteria bacterium]|nr:tRNA dihydrouridine synthase DusB [candidate division Zixibacteria bacterium]
AVENCSIPVTIKTRTGWTKNSDTFLELGKIAEKAGISAIAFHPRSRADGYKNMSDWSKITLLKNEVSIPVIGNGDINTGQDAEKMLSQTGCDAIMIGRAAMRNPYVFYQIKSYLSDSNVVPDMSIREIVELMLEHTQLMINQYGEKGGVLMMRKHLAWYTKGMRGGADLRRQLFCVESYQDICKLFEEYKLNIKASF